jgi:CRISPR-associated protein Csb2
MLIHAPMGLGDAAQRAIRTMRKTWTKGGAGDLQVAVAACGDIKMLRSLPQLFSHSISRLLGPEEGCSVWISSTPFVPARFLKKSGKNSLVAQINAELHSRGLPETEAVSILEDSTREFRHFTISRQRAGNPPPQKLGIALCLKFAEPLNSSYGPLTLGYGSHFGLGLFRAEPPCGVVR